MKVGEMVMEGTGEGFSLNYQGDNIHMKHTTRRFTGYLRLSFIIIGLSVIFLSFVVTLKAQSQNHLDQQVKEVMQQQKSDQDKIISIDKRLTVIETKQDSILYVGWGVIGGLGMLLLERAKDILFAPRRRRDE